MNILNSLNKLAATYRDYAGRSAALKTLRQLDARQLADIGIEPHQLETGISAYPWGLKNMAGKSALASELVTPKAHKPADNPMTLFSAWGQPIRPW